MSFRKILVANRGEIACRVIRTAQAMGYRTVAVYSDADAQSPHVRQADEAVHIGPSTAAQSYLDIAALLEAARRTNADAVHPGYGFLSERGDFAQACADAGLVFIGPPPAAIHAMGNKAGAKRRMIAAGVPCAAGYLPEDDASADDEHLAAEAARLGYPLLVKAVAGGGGRGMRLVTQGSELGAALASARAEAQNAFGNGSLMLERLIAQGRHIEIQVFADTQGNAVHLGERDCTAQRRRQKVIEEAPSPIVTPAMRDKLGADAIAAALAVGYVGAGTVEFIVDGELNHFFLEMNTRLQVEHPVTECVTGFDLVEWQLRVAAGEPLTNWLPGLQADVRLSGHAIEARLYTEDPYDGFRPQTGQVLHWQPAATPSLRIDHGIAEGGAISPYYDAMVAKLIVHGHDREDAIRRLVTAIDGTPLLGVAHNARFLRDVLLHPDFRSARLTTTRLDEWAADGAPLLQRPVPDDSTWLLAAALAARGDLPAGAAAGLRSPGVAWQTLELRCQGEQRRWRACLDGHTVHLDDGTVVRTVRILAADRSTWRVQADGVTHAVVACQDPAGGWHVASQGAVFIFEEPPAAPIAPNRLDPRQVRATVAGVVADVRAQPGQRVEAGQPLICVEAMKMEMWLTATATGRVAGLHVQVRDAVPAGALLVELEIDP